MVCLTVITKFGPFFFQGEKVFYFIEPTEENLIQYEKWVSSARQSEMFFGDMVKNCYSCSVKPGQTLFIPTGTVMNSTLKIFQCQCHLHHILMFICSFNLDFLRQYLKISSFLIFCSLKVLHAHS